MIFKFCVLAFPSYNSTGGIINTVGYGAAAEWYEGFPVSVPKKGESLERKTNATTIDHTYGNAWDSDENSADFFIQDSPNPQSSTRTVEHGPLPPVPDLPSIILFAMGLITLVGYVLLTKKKYWQFLVVFAQLSVFPLCPTSASVFSRVPKMKAIQYR